MKMKVLGSDLDISKTILDLDFGALSGPTARRMKMEGT